MIEFKERIVLRQVPIYEEWLVTDETKHALKKDINYIFIQMDRGNPSKGLLHSLLSWT